jgi:hypothetical protein
MRELDPARRVCKVSAILLGVSCAWHAASAQELPEDAGAAAPDTMAPLPNAPPDVAPEPKPPAQAPEPTPPRAAEPALPPAAPPAPSISTSSVADAELPASDEASRSTAKGQGIGLEVGLRSGYAIPAGKITPAEGDELSEVVSGAIPILFELGYREGQVMLGAYGQYAFGFTGDGFDAVCGLDGVSCSARNVRLGLQLHYHYAPSGGADVWFGIGAGYERLTLDFSGPGGSVQLALSGAEILNTQLGVEGKLAPGLSLGPFLSSSLGIYSDSSCSGMETCPGLSETALHQWWTLGLRGAFTTGSGG